MLNLNDLSRATAVVTDSVNRLSTELAARYLSGSEPEQTIFFEHYRAEIASLAIAIAETEAEAEKPEVHTTQISTQEYEHYRESRSKLSLSQAIYLVFRAFHDITIIGREAFDGRSLHLQKFFQCFSKPLQFNDRVGLPNFGPDATSPTTAFNIIFESLSGRIYPPRNTITKLINDQTLRLRADALLTPLFNVQSYSEAGKKELMADCVGYLSSLPKIFIDNLQVKLILTLEAEFIDSIEAGFIQHKDIVEAADNALTSLSPKFIRKFLSELAPLQAHPAEAEAEEEAPRAKKYRF